jgi:hypothetical protein
MMMWILGVALVLSLPWPAQQDEADEIVVLGRRMSEVRLVLGYDGSGRVACTAAPSSGYPKLDDLMCRHLAECLKPKSVAREQVDTCMERRKTVVIARFLHKLRKQRAEGKARVKDPLPAEPTLMR